MSTRSESNKSEWILPGFVVWGFAPAILFSMCILGGWNSYGFPRATQGEPNLGTSPVSASILVESELGGAILVASLFSMPIFLYPWCIVALKRFAGIRFATATLTAIPLMLVMCTVNIFLGFAGCSVLSNIIPKEGIF